MIYAKQVSSQNEIQQILDLQQQYLRGIKSIAEEKEQGFLTVKHSMEKLQKMHDLEPSIIAKDNDIIAGYALVMHKTSSGVIPELLTLFEGLKKISYKGKAIDEYRYYVMGQICVAENYRGKGIFDLLYKKHKEIFSGKYDFVITEISTRNTRSMRAHERVGFKPLHIHTNDLDEWQMVIWDWSEM